MPTVNVTDPKYYVASLSASKIAYEDVTSKHSTGIGSIEAETQQGLVNIYSLDGRLVRKNVSLRETFFDLADGIYIVNGKKVIK